MKDRELYNSNYQEFLNVMAEMILKYQHLNKQEHKN